MIEEHKGCKVWVISQYDCSGCLLQYVYEKHIYDNKESAKTTVKHFNRIHEANEGYRFVVSLLMIPPFKKKRRPKRVE